METASYGEVAILTRCLPSGNFKIRARTFGFANGLVLRYGISTCCFKFFSGDCVLTAHLQKKKKSVGVDYSTSYTPFSDWSSVLIFSPNHVGKVLFPLSHRRQFTVARRLSTRNMGYTPTGWDCFVSQQMMTFLSSQADSTEFIKAARIRRIQRKNSCIKFCL